MSQKIKIQDVRNALSEKQKAEIIALWSKEDGIPDPDIAAQRLKEVFAIAIDENEKIIGVSSIYPAIDPILKVKLYYLRAYIGEQTRFLKIGTDFAVFIINTLVAEYNKNDLNAPIGAAWIIENELVKKNYKLAVSVQSQSVYYGTDENGNPARVRYFPGAKIPV